MNKKINIVADNVGFEEIKGKTETINLNDKKEKVAEKATINFMDPSFVNDFASRQTKRSPDVEEDKDPNAGKTTEQVREEIRQAESTQDQWTPKDFTLIAEFIITMLDTVISSGLMWWAKDTSYQAYSLPKEKVKQLVSQLSMILIKYQAKFRIEFIFLLSIVMFYAGPFIKAKESRKERKQYDEKIAKKEAEKQADIVEQIVKQTEGNREDVILEPIVETVADNETTHLTANPRRRRPGKQTK